MKQAEVKRTLTAILVADVVGYSRLMGADEAGTLRALTRLRADFIDPTISAHGGRVVNAAGDSLLVEFSSVVDATLCAIALQQGFSERNRELPESKRILYRIGVNIGDVIVQDRALFGDSVNVAARLQALCEPGAISLSSAAHEQVRGKIDADFDALGWHEVKNIARPIEVFALSSAAIGMMTRVAPRTKSTASKRYFKAGAVVLLIAAVAIAAIYWRARVARAEFVARLATILVSTQDKLTEKARSRLIQDYVAGAANRAFVIAPKARAHWWTGQWPTAKIAEDKALERCQIAHDEPCAVVAVDEEILASKDGAPGARVMAKVAYAGDFDPEQIPGVRSVVATRADIVNYRAAPAPKAAAIHPRGVVAVFSGAGTQAEANAKALKACNDDDASRDADGPCYLYAEGDKVVLPSRREKR